MEHLIAHGFAEAFSLMNLGAMAIGVVIGMIFGAIPGLSGATAMTMLLPLTFIFRADNGVLFLIAIWNACMRGRSLLSASTFPVLRRRRPARSKAMRWRSADWRGVRCVPRLSARRSAASARRRR